MIKQNQKVTLPSSRFLFRKLIWDRKAFHILVPPYGTIYADLQKNPPFSNTFKQNLKKKHLGNLTGSQDLQDYYRYLLVFFTHIFIYSFIYLFISFFLSLFIHLFIYFFIHLFIQLFISLLLYLITISFLLSHNLLFAIYRASILLSHYVPNLLLLMSQYHYSFNIYIFT